VPPCFLTLTVAPANGTALLIRWRGGPGEGCAGDLGRSVGSGGKSAKAPRASDRQIHFLQTKKVQPTVEHFHSPWPRFPVFRPGFLCGERLALKKALRHWETSDLVFGREMCAESQRVQSMMRPIENTSTSRGFDD